MSALDQVVEENKQLKQRLRMICELLDEGFDPDEPDVHRYDTQAVNQAHRIAAGGEAPREVSQSWRSLVKERFKE